MWLNAYATIGMYCIGNEEKQSEIDGFSYSLLLFVRIIYFYFVLSLSLLIWKKLCKTLDHKLAMQAESDRKMNWNVVAVTVNFMKLARESSSIVWMLGSWYTREKWIILKA